MDFLAIIAVIFFIAIPLTLIIIIVVIVNKVRSAAKSLSPDLMSLNGIKDFAKRNELELENTPKSINGMESLLTPRIEKDFKGLSIRDLKARNEDEVFAYYRAIETGDMSKFEDNEAINSKITQVIKDNDYLLTAFSGIKVHKHAISNYEKVNGVHTIFFQMAIEYIKKDRHNPSGKKTQIRVETMWVYLPDEKNFTTMNTVGALNCPNCGAPINKNIKVCEYCSASVETDFSRVWALKNIQEK